MIFLQFCNWNCALRLFQLTYVDVIEELTGRQNKGFGFRHVKLVASYPNTNRGKKETGSLLTKMGHHFNKIENWKHFNCQKKSIHYWFLTQTTVHHFLSSTISGSLPSIISLYLITKDKDNGLNEISLMMTMITVVKIIKVK